MPHHAAHRYPLWRGRFLATLFSLTALGLSAACDAASTGLDPVTPGEAALLSHGSRQDVTILSSRDTLNAIGATRQLQVKVLNRRGQEIASPEVLWESLDPEVATVDPLGLITAHSVGTALIMAAAVGLSDTAEIHVRQVVASVTVSPETANVAIGESVRFTAMAADSNGVEIPGATFTWTSSNPSVSVVDVTGLATGVAAGSAMITAQNITPAPAGSNGSASHRVTPLPEPGQPPPTPTPPPSGAWTNEPAGFTRITEHTGGVLQPPGWWLNDWAGNISIVSDASAPFSGSNVLQFRWPEGSIAGDGYGLMGYGWGNEGDPGNMRLPNGSPVREIFVGFYQKVNDGWQQNEAWQSKLFYIYQMHPDGYRDAVIPHLEGPPWGPFQSLVQGFGLDNMFANRTNVLLQPGRWHKWEMYVRVSSREGEPDGEVRWWIDGVLVGDYTGLTTPPTAFTEFHLDPIWGGGGGVKQKTDYLWFDHIYISGR